MDLIRDIASKDLVWAPILMVALISLIGFGIGFWNGWKTAAFFFTWNVIGTLVLVLVSKSMYGGTIKDWAKGMMPSDLKTNLGASLDEGLNLFKGITVLLIMFAGLLIINLVALVVYLFVRKHLKRDIFLNKKNGISNATSRISGGGIGVFTALPFAAALGVLTTGVSQNSGVNQWTSGVAKIATFGQVDEGSKDVRRLYNLALAADAAQGLSQLFSSAATIDADNIQSILDNKESIKNVFEDKTTYELVKTVVLDKHTGTKEVLNPTSIKTHTELAGVLAGASATAQDNIKDIITSMTKSSGVPATDKANIDEVLKFLMGTI